MSLRIVSCVLRVSLPVSVMASLSPTTFEFLMIRSTVLRGSRALGTTDVGAGSRVPSGLISRGGGATSTSAWIVEIDAMPRARMEKQKLCVMAISPVLSFLALRAFLVPVDVAGTIWQFPQRARRYPVELVPVL